MFGKETFLLLFLSISNWTFSSVTLTDTLFISSCFSFTLNVKKKKREISVILNLGEFYLILKAQQFQFIEISELWLHMLGFLCISEIGKLL